METKTVPSAHNNIPTIKPEAKKPVKLEPSFNFMYGLEEEVLGYYDEPSKIKEQPHQKRQSTPPQPKIAEITEKNQKRTVTSRQIGIQQKQDSISRKKTTKNDTTAVKKVKKSSIEKLNINRKSDEKDIQDVIKRFKKNKNPALSLFVAKRFYAIGNYQQSYNYALITNELNSDIEDSWLIFAKSLVKLGQRDMAISTLESYIEDSRSIKAKLLLDSIKNGTMK
jgi:tetratricopeptide (TPR) repeat protein